MRSRYLLLVMLSALLVSASGLGNADNQPDLPAPWHNLAPLAADTDPYALTITGSPADQTVCAGDSASFTVTTSGGTGILHYQWYKGYPSEVGTPITGANLRTYTIEHPVPADKGPYYVVVTRGEETVTSNFAILVVNAAPSVSASPEDQTICAGSSITQIVITDLNNAPGTEFHWTRTNSVNITGIASSGEGSLITGTLNNNSLFAQTTIFTIRAISGLCMSTTVVAVSVNPGPILSVTPNSTSVCDGHALTFHVIDQNNIADVDFVYGRDNTDNVSGMTGGAWSHLNGDTYITGGLKIEHGGYYSEDTRFYFRATNGTCESMVYANVRVNPRPLKFNMTWTHPWCDPIQKIGLDGSWPGTSYQLWGSTSPVGNPVVGTYDSISFGTFSAPGTYGVWATDGNGCTNLMEGVVQIGGYTYPTKYNVTGGGDYCPGGPGVHVGIDNSQTYVNYQLYLDGTIPVGGAVAGTNGRAIDFGARTVAGTYTVVGTDLMGCPSVMTGSATIVVSSGAVITGSPANIEVCGGHTASFTADASGNPPPSVQWQVSTNGGGSFADLTGATAKTLSFTASAGQNGYKYHAVFTSDCGSATTTAATLTVNTDPVVTDNPDNAIVCENQTATFTADATGSPAPTVQWQVLVAGGSIWEDLAGETGKTLDFTATAGMNGNSYHAVFTNACGSATTTAASLRMNTNPVVTDDPDNASICGNQKVTFTADATGLPAPTVQWQFLEAGESTWEDLTGSTGKSIQLTPTSDMSGNQYRAVFTNSCRSATTTAATLTVNSVPVVTDDPDNAIVCENQTATFTADATGSPAPTVQWQVLEAGETLWEDLTGETGKTLDFTATATMNGNSYHAVFTNPCGSVTTTPAMLRMITGPVVTDDPDNVTICENNMVTFTADATGSPAPTVQWQFLAAGETIWEDLTGATGKSIQLTPTADMSGNQYRAVFTNTCGSATTTAAMLSIIMDPVVTHDPENATICENHKVSFTANASGSPAPTVQWQVLEAGETLWEDLTGETGKGLSFTTIVGMSGNQYHAVFTSTCGSTTSLAATLTVNTDPVVTDGPDNAIVCENQTATFTADATGSPAPTVQWQVLEPGESIWVDLTGETGKTLDFTATADMNGNQYRAVFTNACGSTTTTAASLRMNTNPVVTDDPDNASICGNQKVTFTADATGLPAPTVQWQFLEAGESTWEDLTGETGRILSFTATAGMNGNQYRAVFTNTCGSATTTAATLTINSVPVVTDDPDNAIVCENQTATFTADATGSPAPTVQWQVLEAGESIWEDLTGETGKTLDFTATAAMNGNSYHAVFTNTCGSVTTTPAMLRMITGPVVTDDPDNVTICENNMVTFTADATGSPAPTVQWQFLAAGESIWEDLTGSTGKSIQLTPTADMSGNQYRAVFTNTCGSATTTAALLSITLDPVVTHDPENATICENHKVSFTANASGSPAPTVQWQVLEAGETLWEDLTGETGKGLSFTTIVGMSGNQYHAVFTNSCGSTTSLAATLTVNTDPVVTDDPDEATACENQTATFTADATGSPAPTVQWQVLEPGESIWVDLTGETGKTLDFTVTAGMRSNQYHAVFTNTCGAVTTAAATLRVNIDTQVIRHPENDTICENQVASFTIRLAGPKDLKGTMLQWQVLEAGETLWEDLTGETRGTLSFTATAGMNGNQYHVLITDPCGSETSRAATLTVNTDPVVTHDPDHATVCENHMATFTADASGSPVPTVQWQVLEAGETLWEDLTGQTGKTLDFTATAVMNGNQYHALFTNTCVTDTTLAATLTVNTDPVVTDDPDNATVCENHTASFTANATGSPAPTVQWQVLEAGESIWEDLTGQTGKTLDFTATAVMNGNQYHALFTNTCVTDTTLAATLTVNTDPVVTDDPENATVCENHTVSFTANATGSPAPTVQWQVLEAGESIWEDLAGKTGKTLEFTATAVMSGNQYHAVFTNPCGSATTTAATLTVNTDPVVTDDPDNATVCENHTVSFTANATGSPAPTVQWQVLEAGESIWEDLAGKTGKTLGFTATAVMSGNQYHAVFTNTCGSATTTAATLTVNTDPVVTDDPENATVCENHTVSFTANATGSPAPTVQWQVLEAGESIWEDLAGKTGKTLGFTATAVMSGNQYHAVFTNTCGSATTTAATLTVSQVPSIITQPQSQVVCKGDDVTFTVVADNKNGGEVHYQWKKNGSGIEGETSATLSLTGVRIDDAGDYSADVTNDCGTTPSTKAMLAITGVTAVPNPVQYSDPVTYTATLYHGAGFTDITKVTFKIDGSPVNYTPVGLVVSGDNKVATVTRSVMHQPGSGIAVTAEFKNTNGTIAGCIASTTIDILCEDAIIEYNGVALQATGSAQSGSTTVKLIAVVRETFDRYPGNIFNACVRFKLFEGSNTAPSYEVTAKVAPLVDLITGTASVDLTIGNIVDYRSFTITMSLDGCNGYYCKENRAALTVYRPQGDFITGGGHIFTNNSFGLFKGEPNTPANFGFHVKFNKKGTVLQGGMNVIYRRAGLWGIMHDYQIKTNNMLTLGVNIANPANKLGVFTSKANLTDLTTGMEIEGNLRLYVTMTDRTWSGNNDAIGFTLWRLDKKGKPTILLYSSSWNGAATLEQLLAGGNLVVHSGFSLLKTGASGSQEIQETGNASPTDLVIYPNPTSGQASLRFSVEEDAMTTIDIYSSAGQLVQRAYEGFTKSGDYMTVGIEKPLTNGIYFVYLRSGGHLKVRKLVVSDIY